MGVITLLLLALYIYVKYIMPCGKYLIILKSPVLGTDTALKTYRRMCSKCPWAPATWGLTHSPAITASNTLNMD